MGPIDILIVTAVPEEYAAVIAAGGGAGAWNAPQAAPAYRDFDAHGGALRIAVTQALTMGGPAAVIAAADLIKAHDVRCLAMCGVCAGKRGDVELGDVIIADRVWQYGTGKRKAQGGVVEEQEDIEMYRLHPPAWKQLAERFELGNPDWLRARPRSYEAQGDWVLERVLRGGDPMEDPASKAMCADVDKALSRLWKKGLLQDGTLDLTPEGTAHIKRVLLLNRNALPAQKPLSVHVGPIASGNQVMQDDEVFARLSESVRKVIGVEMEAAAIGALAYAKELPFSIVAKAVMDHADADKSDNFKPFAARASAEVLLAFVQKHVPPRAAEAKPPPPWPAEERRDPSGIDHDHILRIHAAAVACGLTASRDALLAGVPQGIAAGIPGAQSPSAQLLNDLNWLRDVGRSTDGSTPLRTWLRNAITLAGPRAQADVFRRALQAVEGKR